MQWLCELTAQLGDTASMQSAHVLTGWKHEARVRFLRRGRSRTAAMRIPPVALRYRLLQFFIRARALATTPTAVCPRLHIALRARRKLNESPTKAVAALNWHRGRRGACQATPAQRTAWRGVAWRGVATARSSSKTWQYQLSLLSPASQQERKRPLCP